MITSFALEFDDIKEMESVASKLWNRHKITGEMQMTPLANGKWRLNIHSEKTIRQSTIDALKGVQVSARDIVLTKDDADEDEE